MTSLVVVDDRFDNDPYKVVYKYRVPLSAIPQGILIPTGARLLHIEFIEHDGPHFLMWYEVDLHLDQTSQSHIYQTFGTGDRTIPKMAKHIATGIMWREDHRGRRTVPQFVWHLYEYPTGARIVEDGR